MGVRAWWYAATVMHGHIGSSCMPACTYMLSSLPPCTAHKVKLPCDTSYPGFLFIALCVRVYGSQGNMYDC